MPDLHAQRLIPEPPNLAHHNPGILLLHLSCLVMKNERTAQEDAQKRSEYFEPARDHITNRMSLVIPCASLQCGRSFLRVNSHFSACTEMEEEEEKEEEEDYK